MHTSLFSSIFVYLSQVISSSQYWTMLSHIADFPPIVQAYAQHRYSFILIIAIMTVEQSIAQGCLGELTACRFSFQLINTAGDFTNEFFPSTWGTNQCGVGFLVGMKTSTLLAHCCQGLITKMGSCPRAVKAPGLLHVIQFWYFDQM